MPIIKVKVGGRTGYKYGESGKVYMGKDAREQARKQGVAIRMSKQRRGLANASKSTRTRVARMGGKSR